MEWTLDQLRQFVLTADFGSFTAAARHQGKAQSAVSMAVALLEADLGLELFDRSRRAIQLTDAGEVLLLEAREVLRQAQELEQRARSLSTHQEAKLVLALDEALPYMAISTLIKELSERSPHLELTLLNGTATEVADYVAVQRADFAFHFDRGPVSAYFDQRHIGSVPQGVFVAAGHPLVAQQPIERKELVRYRQILMHADDVDEVAYSPQIWRSDSFYSIAEMVADDLGWAVLPVNVAKDESYPKPLQQVLCPSLALPLLSVRMLWHQGRLLSPTEQWIPQRFAELLRQDAL